MKLGFVLGFVAGAGSMLGLILWVYSDREGEMSDVTFSADNGKSEYRFRGHLLEIPHA